MNMKINIIIGKSAFDTSLYMAKLQKIQSVSTNYLRFWSLDDLHKIKKLEDVKIFQTPEFASDPDENILDFISALNSKNKYPSRQIWFDDKICIVDELDIRIMIDHSGIESILCSENEFRYFGSFKIGLDITHFIASGIEITQFLGLPKIKLLGPYVHIRQEENKFINNETN